MLTRRDKYLVFFLNALMMIFGTGLFVLGFFWMQVEIEYEKATHKQTIYVGAVLMGMGLNLGITTIVGCGGTIANKQFLLDLTGFWFLIIFLIYADYGIIAFQLTHTTSLYMGHIKQELTKIFEDQSPHWKILFDYLQQKFKCCGISRPDDYQKYHATSHLKSCCSDIRSQCQTPDFRRGCLNQFIEHVTYNFVISASLAFAISGFALLASAFTYIVRKNPRMPQNPTTAY